MLKNTVLPNARLLKRKKVKVGFWFTPAEKAELSQLAKSEGLSLSQIGRAFVVESMRRKLHAQQDDLLFPKLRQLLREDREAADNRSRHFLIETAFAAEQSRILITNVLHYVLNLAIKGEQAGEEIEKTQENIVRRSSDTARNNILDRFMLPVQPMLEKWKGGNTKDRQVNGKEKERTV